MVKTCKIVVCGMKGVGKTAILEQELHSTIEDIYMANIESDKGNKENVHFYDTAGIDYSQTTVQQLPRHYLILADGYIMVYDTENSDSFDVLVSLKKDIDRNKDKKEVTIVVIGNKTKETESNLNDLIVNKAISWCGREKIKHFLSSAFQRNSLYEPFVYITSKLNPPPSKSTFTPLSMGRKVLKDSN